MFAGVCVAWCSPYSKGVVEHNSPESVPPRVFAGLVAGVCDADACTLRGPGFGAPVFNISMIMVFNISALYLH